MPQGKDDVTRTPDATARFLDARRIMWKQIATCCTSLIGKKPTTEHAFCTYFALWPKVRTSSARASTKAPSTLLSRVVRELGPHARE
jgi:hypothetical protein